MIKPESVQEVINITQVEDVVGEYVHLKNRGINMIGLCPFHNEKTPSFTVSPAKNLYKCFGCGKAGGGVQFLMEHEGMSFPDAIRHLAQKYGIEIEETKSEYYDESAQLERDSFFLINDFARDLFISNLMESDEGKRIGLSYFKERGFRENTIQKFELGFALKQRDFLTKTALKKGYKEDSLKKLGLTSQKDYDFFRDRVMFPIHSLSGKVIAFGGRTLSSDKKIPKYINSPETKIYNKSKSLYGIYQAKTEIKRNDDCILVEGYTDVISLSQAGIENAVASSGTALTEEQIRLVKRFTSNIKLLYDGDTAGIKAASRGLDLALSQDLNVSVVPLPDGEDPDSLVQKLGSTEFSAFLSEKSEDFILFKTKRLIEESKNNPIQKSKSISEIVSSIAKIPDPIKRSVYIKECSGLLEMDEAALMETANKALKNDLTKKWADRKREAARKEREDNRNIPLPSEVPPDSGESVSDIVPKKSSRQQDYYKERDILKLLLNYGHKVIIEPEGEGMKLAELLIANLEDVIDHFQNPTYKQMIEIAQNKVNNDKTVIAKDFINHSEKSIRTMAVTLCAEEFEYSPNWEEMHNIDLRTQPKPEDNFFTEAMQAIKYFKLSKIKSMMKENREKMKEKDADVILLVKTHQRLLEIRNELAKDLRIVLTH